MTLKLPVLAYVLITVGLVLSGALYMRLTLNPPYEDTSAGVEEVEETDVNEEEEEKIQEETTENSAPPPPVSTPDPLPATTPTPTPTPAPTAPAYTMANVRTHASSASCWSVINGNVYDLTEWINRHPGGRSAITALCGKDGTASFESEHEGDRSAESRLSSLLLGPLE